MDDITKVLLLAGVLIIHPWVLAWFLGHRIMKMIDNISVTFENKLSPGASIKVERDADQEEEVPPGAPQFVPPKPEAPVFSVTLMNDAEAEAEEERDEYSDYEGKL